MVNFRQNTRADRRRWTPDRIPDLTGTVAVVTGSNSGIGYVTARELAARGACTVLACRSEERGKEALDRLHAQVPGAWAELRLLDLASQASIRSFAEDWDHSRLDLLVNNAAVVVVPNEPTEDGFEPHFGVNHLGTYALTGRLLPHLAEAPAPRVVTVSSEQQRFSRLNLDREPYALHSRRSGDAMGVYGRSKQANVYFAAELQRRADAAGLPLRSIVAIPGLTDTGVLRRGANAGRGRIWRMNAALVHLVAKPVDKGAWPLLYAATDAELPGGAYICPAGPFQTFGRPAPHHGYRAARDKDTARRLWELSERLTGVRAPVAS